MLNICQVSLARDIPIILENFHSFKKFYKSVKIFVICPASEINEFKKKLIYPEFNIINEDDLISFKEFQIIYERLSSLIKYQELFKNRLSWYYQQALKLNFVLDFVDRNKEDIVIWDADTIILNKIEFFKNKKSIKYGTLFEFHRHYFKTNNSIIGEHPRYFISSLVQFIGLSVSEYYFFCKKIENHKLANKNEKTAFLISRIILENIFKSHNHYNGSLFSEYELIGISNLMYKNSKQKAIFTLRANLNGKLSNLQFYLAKSLNVRHVTYEHSYLNQNSQGMLMRKQKWAPFIKILIKGFIKFHLRNIKHNFNFYYNSYND